LKYIEAHNIGIENPAAIPWNVSMLDLSGITEAKKALISLASTILDKINPIRKKAIPIWIYSWGVKFFRFRTILSSLIKVIYLCRDTVTGLLMGQPVVDHDCQLGEKHCSQDDQQVYAQCVIDNEFIIHPGSHEHDTDNNRPTGGNISVHDEAFINNKPLGKKGYST
jgi:hypothetical protein